MRAMPDLYDIFIHQLAQMHAKHAVFLIPKQLFGNWISRFVYSNRRTVHTEIEIITDKKMVLYLFNFILLLQMRMNTVI